MVVCMAKQRKSNVDLPTDPLSLVYAQRIRYHGPLYGCANPNGAHTVSS